MRGLVAGRRRLIVPLIALLIAAPVVSAAVTRSRPRARSAATGRALRALGSARHTGAEIVFGLPAPLSAGTVITQGGPAGPGPAAPHAGPLTSPARVIARLARPAWFFYEDLAPFQQYSHPGRIALVDAATGRVTLSSVIQWPPAVDGRLPPFLASQISYDSGADRVFYRPYTVKPTPDFTPALATRAARAASDSGSIDPAEGPLVARLIAADHACTVRVTDTVAGGYYAFAHVTQSRAALDYRFTELSGMGARLRSFLYPPASHLSPTQFVARQIARHGCRDVLLYLAGAGYASGPAVNVGMGLTRHDVIHQDITASALRALIAGHRRVNFELVVDAAHAAGFHALARRLKNLLLVATASAPHGGAFTYLPQVRIDGHLKPNQTNPLRLLQLTDRLVFGIDRVTGSPLEVAQMQALGQAGKLPSALAYLIARALARGGAVDFVGLSGAGSAPAVQTHGFSAGPPSVSTPPGGESNPPPTAAAPVLGGIESASLAYDAGAFPVSVTSSLTVVSRDVPTLTGATASISSGFAAGQDALSFTAQHGITGTYDAATGVLTLTGSATAAAYQAALRSVTYADADGASPSTGARTISFRVQRGTAPNGQSNVVSRTVQVNPNPPPVAAADAATTDKQTPVTIAVLANDSDPNGLPLHVDPASIGTTGTKGTVTVNPDNTITYNPNGQFASLSRGQTATDTFTYQASNGFHDSAPATVTITITGSNTPVLANIESTTLPYDAGTSPVPVTSTVTIADPFDATLAGATVAITSGLVPGGEDQLGFTAANGITGSFNPATGVLTMTGTASVADYQAALRSVTYADLNGTNPSTGSRTVAFTVDNGQPSHNLSNVVSRTVQVNPNPPPVAGAVAATTDKHTAVDIAVLPSASDADGDVLSVASVDTTGTTGAVSINPDGTIHYDPNGRFDSLQQGQTATDSFTYRVSDGFHESAPATVTVTITGVNDPPVLTNLGSAPLSYRAQSPAVAVSPTLTLSDDDDTTMSAATVMISAGFNAAADQLAFTNQNGITGSYSAATGVLTLSGTAPLADYETALRSVTFATTDGSASPAPRTVTFAVTDSTGTTGAPASRQIDVSAGPLPPAVNADTYTAVGNTPLAVGTTVSGPAVTVANGSVLSNDTDPNPGGTLSAAINSQPANGSVTMNADGTFTYTPNTGYSGTDTFTYTATDSASGKTATGTVTITVGPVVWYVDNAKAAAGSGTADAPFNTLAAANTSAGANSIVFLYQGSGPYTGGVTLQPGEQLLGQPNGLAVNGNVLVAPGGSAPAITNSGGDGIDLAAGADVEGVSVSGPAGNGIAAGNVNSAVVGETTPVSVSGAGADGLHVSGGSGTLALGGLSISGAAGHSVAISGRTGGTVTIGGSVADTATGISLTSNTGATINLDGTLTLTTGSHPAFTATGGGTVTAPAGGSTATTTTGTAVDVLNTTIGAAGLSFQSVSSNGALEGIDLSNTGSAGSFTVTGTGAAGSGGTLTNTTATDTSDAHLGAATFENTGPVSLSDMTITSPAGDGVGALEVPRLTLLNNAISGAGDDGVLATLGTGAGDTTSATFDIANNTITGAADTAVSYVSQSGGTLTGFITGNTIGNPGNTATSGAVSDGIDLWSTGNGGTVTASITNNAITGVAQGFGINAKAQDQPGETLPPTLNLTATGNTIDDTATTTQDGMTIASGNQLADVVCLNVSANTATSGGTVTGNGNYDADGMSAYQLANTSVFEIVGGPTENVTGGAPNNIVEDPAVEAYLAAHNTLNGPGGAAFAAQEGAAGFTGASSCPTAPAPLAAHVARLARAMSAATASGRVVVTVAKAPPAAARLRAKMHRRRSARVRRASVRDRSGRQRWLHRQLPHRRASLHRRRPARGGRRG